MSFMKLLSLVIGVLLSLSSLAIVGGERVESDDYESTLALTTCSAVLIHPRIIITAAHCIHDQNFLYDDNRVDLYFGEFAYEEQRSSSIRRYRRNRNKRIVRYDAVKIQPQYNQALPGFDESFHFIFRDLAYIKLSEPITDIVSADLGLEGIDFGANNNFHVVGYGEESFGSRSRNTMDRAKKGITLSYHSHFDTRVNLNDHDESEYLGPCRGDSGGGMYSENNGMKLVAITISAPSNCSGDSVSTYEPIIHSIDWIQEDSGITIVDRYYFANLDRRRA